MLIRLPTWMRVTLAVLAVILSTCAHVLPLLAVTLFKVLLPMRAARMACNQAACAIAASWCEVNSRVIDTFTRTRVRATVEASLRPDGHYLLLVNHQSWVDIPLMQKVLNWRIPLPRFFIKSELFWVPLLGLAWWALDFPFMKRYTREQVARRPELAGRDIEATRRACAKFHSMPVTISSFVEGTRFTPAKQAAQKSPYRHLLRPRSGGIAFVMEAMGDGLQAILDLTIVYPAGRPSLADLFTNRIPEVLIDVRERPIPHDLISGDYRGDADFRARFQDWMNTLWAEKDANIERMLAKNLPLDTPSSRCPANVVR